MLLTIETTHQPATDLGYPEKLLIAPKRHANYKRLREGLMTLKAAGVAE